MNREEQIAYHIKRLVESCQQVQPSLEHSTVRRFDLEDRTMLVVPELLGKPTMEIDIDDAGMSVCIREERHGIPINATISHVVPIIGVTIYADWAIRLIHPDGTLITHIDCKRAFLREWWTKEVSNEQDCGCAM